MARSSYFEDLINKKYSLDVVERRRLERQQEISRIERRQSYELGVDGLYKYKRAKEYADSLPRLYS